VPDRKITMLGPVRRGLTTAEVPLKPNRLALVAAAAVALATTVVSAGGTADAAAGNVHSKRVCAQASAGFAACDSRVRTDANLKPLATSGPTGYSPAQLRSAYGITSTGSATTTVAVVDAYAHPNAAADLAVYRNTFGLGAADLTQVNQTGGSTLPRGNTGWGQEEMLDLEMVSAICPACKILYVGASSASFTDLGTAVNTAARLGATVISNSYGGGESSSETTIQNTYYTHPGVAITVSSGDSGYGAQSPAAFNTVTAVGGTNLKLTSTGTRASETVWSGAGSGCSAYITKPAWQHDTGCARRTIADVAAVADPATGVSVYDTYGSKRGLNWYVFGGTSVAAPIIGGVYALSGNTAGTPAQLAYTNAASLFDVTSGSNGSCGGSYLCTGVAGFDGPTGNGTPNSSLAAF
jgi:subtilase family serine protease